MIGRKARKRVVYVDGIPIESNLLNAGESGLKGGSKNDPTALAALDPRALFDKYDVDGSGDIDFDEFKVLLKDLAVNLTEPKARAYFKKCDRRRRGGISYEEFRVALYACDPKNPNRTGGFAPGQALGPKDLFEMFDKDEEGAIDRGTFMELLEFIGKEMPLDKMEELFASYEDPEQEMMPYIQFKKAWLTIVDVQAELRLRGERFNKFLPPAMLAKKLAMVVSLEEKQEARTLLEADHILSDELVETQRREIVKEAHILARVALAEALDAAGQVYVFGKGANQRFDNEPREPDFVEFMEYGIVKELWHERVCPRAKHFISSKDNKQVSNGKTKRKSATSTDSIRPSPSRTKIDTSERAFADRQVSKATAFLWGKRVRQVACGAAVAYALTDAGEVFCWGGNKRRWQYFYDESTAESHLTPSTPHSTGDGVADPNAPALPLSQSHHHEPSTIHRPLTSRSEMLKLFALPSQIAESHELNDKLALRQKYANVFEKPVPLALTDEDKARRLRLVGQYYGLLDPVRPTTSSQRPSTSQKPASLEELMETVEPELHVDDLSLSLHIRGVEVKKPTRMALLEAVGECFELELECIGSKFHDHFKLQDQIARRYRKERRDRALASLIVKSMALWFELSQLRQKMAAAEHERVKNGEVEYDNMKRKVTTATQKLKRRAREGHSAIVVAGSNNNDAPEAEETKSLLYINGLTSRGPEINFFNGSQALESISVGSRHALAIHSSGKLYTWGVGSYGRLGGAQSTADIGDNKESGFPVDSWHRDVYSAQVIPAVRHVRFRAIACGFGHSLALSTEGAVYAWGSATHGKLGIGAVKAQESFTLAPIVLSSLISSGIRVRKIACGPSHSALLTTDGVLFVWGCGDGGRLGLGDGRDVGEDRVPRNGGQLRVIPTPIRVVEPFGHEKLIEVGCGASHTVVVSAVRTDSGGKPSSGGNAYVAGSSHALGKFTPQFTRVEFEDATTIVKASCGSAHTALVTTEGELYTWGKNVNGSTGHPANILLVERPTRVGCMFERPRNLCLDDAATATQSSQNASCIAEHALSGGHAARELQRRRQTRRGSGIERPKPSSVSNFAQTQQELCPFWQVSLAERCRIAQVRVIVMFPSFGETDATSRSTTVRPHSAATTGTKYVVLVSEEAFDSELRGKQALAKARAHSTHTSLSGTSQSELTWAAPADTFGRFVRVQLESSSGVTILSLQRVEVLGSSSEAYVGPRVSDVVCAEAMTVAICFPSSRRDELREKYQRAVRADRASVGVLSQLETFHPFVREEEEEVRAEDVLYSRAFTAKSGIEKRELATAIAALEAKKRAATCVLCRPHLPCVVCEIEHRIQATQLKLASSKSPVAGPQPHLHLQKDTKHGRVKQANTSATAIEVPKRPEPPLRLEALCMEFLSMDMRTKEEVEEAQKRIDLELMDPEALARAKQEEETKAQQPAGQVTAGPIALQKTLGVHKLLLKLLGLLSQKPKSIPISHS